MRAPSAMSGMAATWTWRSPCARSSCPAAWPTCRRAPAWSPTPIRSSSSRRRCARPGRSSRPSSRPRPCHERSEGRRAGQLRLLHLQLGAAAGRAGRAAGRLPQRRRDRGGAGRTLGFGGLARAGHADGSRRQRGGDPRAQRPAAGPGRLPGPPGPCRGLRRPGGAPPAGARQDLLRPPRPHGRLRRAARSPGSHSLPFAGGRPRHPSTRAGGHRVDPRRGRDGHPAPHPAHLRSAVPSRVRAHEGRPEDPRQLPAPARAGGMIEQISKLVRGESLTETEASAAMEKIMSGDATPAQIAGFVVALRIKGESADELTGLARAARANATPIDAGEGLLDTCGTGGDGTGTFNISTLAAIVAAAAGARVAKHGNRAASSVCGSADVLEQLGVKIDLPPEGVARCIEGAGIGFLFAPIFHPLFLFAGPVRREIGIRTVFNLLGPIANPAGVRRILLGVPSPALGDKIARVLAELGTEHALVVHGEDGLDEISPSGPTRTWEVREGMVRQGRIDPSEVGLSLAPRAEITGGAPATNAAIARGVLDGATGGTRSAVLLNAGAACYVAGLARDVREGIGLAAAAIDRGAAGDVLERFIAASHRVAAAEGAPA